MKKMIYLDHAAGTPTDPQVWKTMLPYFSERFYNPSATYLGSRQVADDIKNARFRVAQWLGVRPTEITFTAGGTEANNLAISGVMELHPEANIVVSSIEHESVLEPARRYQLREAPVSEAGIVDAAQLEKLIDDHTVIVSIMYANNEVGSIQPIHEIARIVGQKRVQRQKRGSKLPLYMHTDACQAAAYLDLHVARLGVDMMTLNGGKIYGPKQSGALFVKTDVDLAPQILGGGQEFGRRSGTENVAGIIGFAEALDLVQTRRKAETGRLQRLQALFFDQLKLAIPNVIINGSLHHRLPNNVHITLPGADNERLIMNLDERGIQCAAGSACSASNEEPSHVLRAMGVTEGLAQSSLRLTMGNKTTESDVRSAVRTLRACLPGEAHA